MPKPSTPGAGGAYRYDDETQSFQLLEATDDPLAPPNPYEPEPDPTPEPEPDPETPPDPDPEET